ncbi:MAG: penicillin-binding protein 2 [Candidatus Manganitrophaceae bacterium]|nr:MAG: penicillin-binding protein 2 [Candidatus Manganitrophaceae bacterium]
MRESYLPQEETRDLQSRIYWLFGLIILALFGLLLRAWYLQGVNGKFYLELSENNRVRVVETPPPRGLIYDRNGALLVNNVPSFTLYVVLGDMPDPASVLPRLADLVGMTPEEMTRRLTFKKEDPFFPIKVKDDLTMREVALIEGHGLDLPGVKIEAEFKRNAIHGILAAHLLGYVGEITQAQLESGTYQNIRRGGIIGQYGIEQTFDSIIRGTPGQKRIEVDALGHEIRVLEVNEPQRGDDVYLSLDLNLQKVAEEALGNQSGAIVAMDPKNGEVLAMVSHPAFNPNLLSQGASSHAWEALLKDEGRPLTNRVIQGQYPPGSTFKIVLGAALLETKEATPASRVECRGFLPFGNRNFKDWKRGGHGSVDLHRALVESCDVYFYEMGNRLGIDTISKYSHLFGLGQQTGIELASEKGGLIPSTEWKRQARKEPWYPGETLSVSIGQGYVTVTPLQQTMMINVVANQGVLHPPQLLKKIRDQETGSIQEIPASEGKHIPVSPETFRVIQNALAGVVSDPHGTATGSKSQLVSMGGKTGTAQVIGLKGGVHGKLPDKFNDHAWFVAFAPVESPKIGVTVLVENGGHGGSAAAPLAKKVIEAYLGVAPSLEPEPMTVKSPAPPPPIAVRSEG